MKPKIKISSCVVERLQQVDYECCGSLYGVYNNNSQIIIGLYLKTENTRTADIIFPTEIDMCGVFQVGNIDLDSVHTLVKDVDVTDNPIFLAVSMEPHSIQAHFVINDKLEPAPIEVLPIADIYSSFIHVRLRGQVPLICERHLDAIREGLLAIRKLIASGKITFQSKPENVFIHNTHENMISIATGVVEDLTLHNLSMMTSEVKNRKIKPETSNDQDFEILLFNMYRVVTIEAAEKLHAPVIQVDRHNAEIIHLNINIDALTLVSRDTPLSKLYTILVEACCRNLRLFGRSIMDQIEEDTDRFANYLPEIYHFCPPSLGHFITRVICKNESEEETAIRRNILHRDLLLSRHHPLFRRANRHIFKGDVQGKGGRIVNPHENSKPSNNDGEQALVKGKYEYYHYLQDNMDDDGWGCAYRSLQTLASWFQLQGYTSKEVPTFKEIQQCLFDIGDKPASFVNSRQWIGSTEVNYVLDSLMGVTSKILYVSSGEELADKGPELLTHFKMYGSPIMIGGGVLAHTILGVDYNHQSGALKFLILDPHYTGRDDLQVIVSKGWCAWKDCKFWDKKSYYNMCMPQVPHCV